MDRLRTTALPLLFGLVLALAAGCRRSPATKQAPDGGTPPGSTGPMVCVEQPDGCVFCAGREEGVFLEPDQSRPYLCDPNDDEQCVEFCSTATPVCAMPWGKVQSCMRPSDLEFRRALFNLRAADRPELFLQGRVIDDAGRRIEGASLRVWLSWGASPGMVPLVDEVSGKDGAFRIPLRSGPWSYALRIMHPEHATTIIDKIPGDKLERTPAAPGKGTAYRMGVPQSIRGKVVDVATGLPVSGALIHAVRAPGDVIAASEATSVEDGTFTLGGLEVRRYLLNVSRFGWRPGPDAINVAAPATRVVLKMVQSTVIRGTVVDADGVAEPSATVAAVLASTPGVSSPAIFWTSDGEGIFAQDHFALGTWYLWARQGDMISYPPSRIELSADQVVDVRMTLGHKGGRVSGTVQLSDAELVPGTVSIELASRSPLAFPRSPIAKVDGRGHFVVTGVSPGRHRITARMGPRTISITSGPREVEMPIEPGQSISLERPLVLRARIED